MSGTPEQLAAARAKRVYVRRSAFDRAMDLISPEPTTGCWLWTGDTCGSGYGKLKVPTDRNWSTFKNKKAHRIIYEALRGPIPPGMDLDHLCRTRPCVNPAHLEPVTRSQNLKRSPLVGRYARGRV